MADSQYEAAPRNLEMLNDLEELFGLPSWPARRFAGEATAGKNVVRAANAAAAVALRRLEEKIYGPENQDVPAETE